MGVWHHLGSRKWAPVSVRSSLRQTTCQPRFVYPQPWPMVEVWIECWDIKRVRKWASGVIWDLRTLISAGPTLPPAKTTIHIFGSTKTKTSEENWAGTQWYLDLKVLRIWGMLKSMRWLILIRQIGIVRLILEIFWVQLHRLPSSKSEFSRYSWTSY